MMTPTRYQTDAPQLLVLMLPFMPESHMYYVRKGDHEKAKKSMARIYGTAKDYDLVSYVALTFQLN